MEKRDRRNGKASYAHAQGESTGHAIITHSGHQWPMNFRHGEGGNRGGTMKLRKITAIAGAAAVLGLGLGACGSSGGSVAPVSHAPAKVQGSVPGGRGT